MVEPVGNAAGTQEHGSACPHHHGTRVIGLDSFAGVQLDRKDFEGCRGL